MARRNSRCSTSRIYSSACWWEWCCRLRARVNRAAGTPSKTNRWFDIGWRKNRVRSWGESERTSLRSSSSNRRRSGNSLWDSTQAATAFSSSDRDSAFSTTRRFWNHYLCRMFMHSIRSNTSDISISADRNHLWIHLSPLRRMRAARMCMHCIRLSRMRSSQLTVSFDRTVLHCSTRIFQNQWYAFQILMRDYPLSLRATSKRRRPINPTTKN